MLSISGHQSRLNTRLWTNLWIICGSIVRSRKFYTQEFRHCFVFIIANSSGKTEHWPRQRGSVGVDGSLAWFAHPPGRARRSGEKSAPGTNLLLGECGPARTGGRLFGGNRPSPWRATSRDATTLSFPAIGPRAGGRAETGGRPSGLRSPPPPGGGSLGPMPGVAGRLAVFRDQRLRRRAGPPSGWIDGVRRQKPFGSAGG